MVMAPNGPETVLETAVKLTSRSVLFPAVMVTVRLAGA